MFEFTMKDKDRVLHWVFTNIVEAVTGADSVDKSDLSDAVWNGDKEGCFCGVYIEKVQISMIVIFTLKKLGNFTRLVDLVFV